MLNYKIRGGRALAYPLLSMIRLAIFVAVLVRYREVMMMQVVVIILNTVFQMMWLDAYHPYKTVRRNYAESINEFVVIVVVDLLLFTSDPTLGSTQRSSIGIVIIVVISANILAN